MKDDQIQTGDILLVSGGWWIARQIRRVTGSTWNHAGIIARGYDGWYVYESEKQGLIPTAWDSEKYASGKPTDRKLMIRRYKGKIPEMQAIRFCKEYTGRRRYDFFALLHQIPYNFFNIWIGRTEEKASKRFYCSEWCAYFHNHFVGTFTQWWKISPGRLAELHQDEYIDIYLN